MLLSLMLFNTTGKSSRLFELINGNIVEKMPIEQHG